MLFRIGPQKKKPRVRYIYQAAVQIEEDGIAFYTRLAHTATRRSVARLAARLAREEASHRRFFQEALAQWVPLGPDSETLQALMTSLRQKGLFEAPPPFTNRRALIHYAIAQEGKTVDFYSTFEKEFPSIWKRMQIQRIVMEEKQHQHEMMALLADPKF